MKNSKTKRPTVGKKLLLQILLLSSAITLLFTVVSFYFDYRNEARHIKDVFNYVKNINLPSLSHAVYEIDETQILSQGNGILKHKAVTQVRILDEYGKPYYDRKTSPDGSDTATQFPGSSDQQSLFSAFQILSFLPFLKGETEVQNFPIVHSKLSSQIGLLTVAISKDTMYERLGVKVFYFFVTQLLKTLIVSAFILLVFHYLITRRLFDITRFLTIESSNNDARGSRQFQTKKRDQQRVDELSDLVSSINKMLQEQWEHNRKNTEDLIKKEKIIEVQKAAAFNSAKLASLGEMAGGIAHEINNPLAIIKGFTELIAMDLQKSPDESEKYNDTISKIQITVERIRKIVSGLLEFARDGSKDSFKATKLITILNSASELIKSRLSGRTVELTFDFESITDETLIECRDVQISQVLINLVNNAVDAIATVEDKWIKISAIDNSEDIEISITDSGFGLSDEAADRLFQPFFTTKGPGKGTGLGLSISHSIVEMHSGTLTVDKNCKNTRFVITLPKYLNSSTNS